MFVHHFPILVVHLIGARTLVEMAEKTHSNASRLFLHHNVVRGIEKKLKQINGFNIIKIVFCNDIIELQPLL